MPVSSISRIAAVPHFRPIGLRQAVHRSSTNFGNPLIDELSRIPAYKPFRFNDFVPNRYCFERQVFVKGVLPWLTPLRMAMYQHSYRSFRVEGTENLPPPKAGPVIFAVNHQSTLDPEMVGFTIAHYFDRNIWSMAKKELFRTRLDNWVFPLIGALPFVREAKGDDLVETLKSYASILFARQHLAIFAEGTRPCEIPRKGERVTVSRGDVRSDTGLSATSPLIPWLALATGAEVVPVGVSGTGAARPPEKLWKLVDPATLARLVAQHPDDHLDELCRERIKSEHDILIRFGKPINMVAAVEQTLAGQKRARGFTNPILTITANSILMKAISDLVDHSMNEVPISVPMGPADFARITRYRERMKLVVPDLFEAAA